MWHEGLLIKLKERFSTQLFNILKSYLSDRYFYVRYRQHSSDLFPVRAGVPQGSILGPVLYSLYTADIPVAPQTTIATYADDTVIMASHKDPIRATEWLQSGLDLMLLYKAMLKPIWTYGLELWGSASNSNVEILQRFENKYLRMITGAPWFTPNYVIRSNSDLPMVKEEIVMRMKRHKEKVKAHTNPLAQDLLVVSYEQRLKRRRVADFNSL
ncbi:hypothetical protein DMENIID0001_008600 [Sergentomyia squamirostris]